MEASTSLRPGNLWYVPRRKLTTRTIRGVFASIIRGSRTSETVMSALARSVMHHHASPANLRKVWHIGSQSDNHLDQFDANGGHMVGPAASTPLLTTTHPRRDLLFRYLDFVACRTRMCCALRIMNHRSVAKLLGVCSNKRGVCKLTLMLDPTTRRGGHFCHCIRGSFGLSWHTGWTASSDDWCSILRYHQCQRTGWVQRNNSARNKCSSLIVSTSDMMKRIQHENSQLCNGTDTQRDR